MGAVVEIWLKSLIDTFIWGYPHSAVLSVQQLLKYLVKGTLLCRCTAEVWTE